MLYINVRVEETVRWTCTCAGNAKSVDSESAKRWACWQNVSKSTAAHYKTRSRSINMSARESHTL